MATRSIGICTAVAALAADQASKAFVLANAEALATGVAVFPGFNLIFHRNYGVTFGFFQNVPWWVLALVATAVVLFLVVSLIRATQAAEAVAYGMVIGGALGNIVDRLRFGGVTDFLDFYLGTAHWPAFNLADVFVVCGVGILLIFSGREKVAASETSRQISVISIGITVLRISGMSGIILTFCAFGLGALAVLALPPFSMPVLLPVAFGALYLLTVGESRMRAGLAGWAFGVGYFLFGLSWIAESFFVDPERLAWMAVPAVAGLAAGLALFPAAAMAAFAWSRTKGVSGALIFAVCWSVSEWLRGTMLTGFPWNLIAYTWADYDIPRQMAAWVGSYGLGLLTVLLSVLPVTLLMRNRRQNAFAAFVFMSVVGGAGTLGTVRLMATTPPTDTTVRTVQGNILQTEKWDPAFRDRNISRYLDLSAQSGSFDVLLWPESAFPGYLDENPEMLDQIAERLPEGRVLLTGAQTRESAGTGTRYRNSILAVDQTGRIVTRYAKHHLVPFGEYVPLRGFLPLQRLTIGLGDFTPGPGPQTVELPGLSPVGLSICYEAIFPGRVVDAASRPDWIFNATNDAWFGASLGPRQHLASARMRAVEEGLPMVRAANTGISAVIDGYGRIVARLGLDETGFLDARLPAALPATSFAKYGQMMFLLVLAACIAGAIGLTIGKEKAP